MQNQHTKDLLWETLGPLIKRPERARTACHREPTAQGEPTPATSRPVGGLAFRAFMRWR
jgi:hypothetical protein